MQILALLSLSCAVLLVGNVGCCSLKKANQNNEIKKSPDKECNETMKAMCFNTYAECFNYYETRKTRTTCVCKGSGFKFDESRRVCYSEVCNIDEKKLCPAAFSKCERISTSDGKYKTACICNHYGFEYDPQRKICQRVDCEDNVTMIYVCEKTNAKCALVYEEDRAEPVKTCACNDGNFTYDRIKNICFNRECNPSMERMCAKANAECVNYYENETLITTCHCKEGFKFHGEKKLCFNRNCDASMQDICSRANGKCFIFYENKKIKAKCECKDGFDFDESRKLCARRCYMNEDCKYGGKCEIQSNQKYFCKCKKKLSGDSCEIIIGCKDIEAGCINSLGKCMYNELTEEAYCACPARTLFNPNLKMCQALCDPNPCVHGTCELIVNHGFTCKCHKPYGGPFCNITDVLIEEVLTERRTTLIVGGILGAFSACEIIVVICLLTKKSNNVTKR